MLRCLFGQWESPYDRNHLVQCVAGRQKINSYLSLSLTHSSRSLDTCLHPGFIRNGRIYVVNYGTSRYILSVNVSLRHGVSLQFECNPGRKKILH